MKVKLRINCCLAAVFINEVNDRFLLLSQSDPFSTQPLKLLWTQLDFDIDLVWAPRESHSVKVVIPGFTSLQTVSKWGGGSHNLKMQTYFKTFSHPQNAGCSEHRERASSHVCIWAWEVSRLICVPADSVKEGSCSPPDSWWTDCPELLPCTSEFLYSKGSAFFFFF